MFPEFCDVPIFIVENLYNLLTVGHFFDVTISRAKLNLLPNEVFTAPFGIEGGDKQNQNRETKNDSGEQEVR